MTADARIQQVSEHLIRAITEDPTADYEMLESVTCGLVTKEATEGNGLDVAKRYYRSLRNLTGDGESEQTSTFGTPTTKRGRKPGSKSPMKVTRKVKTKTATKATSETATTKRGRPKGSKNKTTTTKKATTKATVASKTTGAAKKRGRPKGSKNMTQDVEQTTTD